ncbi:MAG: ComF family protein [Clostridiales Family XIII bacterium]|jgi:ComF family protein|nr:ComF family protein [Clostridiales Family XIII bacterium]
MGFFKRAAELIFPSNIYCIACGNVVDETRVYALCDKCMNELAWNTGKVCAKCGKSLENDRADGEATDTESSGVRDELCFDCQKASHAFRKGYACVTYAGNAKEIVRSLKYRDNPYIAEKLAKIMWERIREEIDEETGEVFTLDLILPVPMHIMKRRKRGYDQAVLIARRLSERMEIPCDENCIIRDGETAVMSSLGRSERKLNVSDAFSMACGAAERVAGKNILLVDDVFTTGSTADACASVLYGAGAANVDIFVFAAGMNMQIKER